MGPLLPHPETSATSGSMDEVANVRSECIEFLWKMYEVGTKTTVSLVPALQWGTQKDGEGE